MNWSNVVTGSKTTHIWWFEAWMHWSESNWLLRLTGLNYLSFNSICEYHVGTWLSFSIYVCDYLSLLINFYVGWWNSEGLPGFLLFPTKDFAPFSFAVYGGIGLKQFDTQFTLFSAALIPWGGRGNGLVGWPETIFSLNWVCIGLYTFVALSQKRFESQQPVSLLWYVLVDL